MCITQIDSNHQLTLFTVEARPKNALNGPPAHNTMKDEVKGILSNQNVIAANKGPENTMTTLLV
jgi:hypothetical protein